MSSGKCAFGKEQEFFGIGFGDESRRLLSPDEPLDEVREVSSQAVMDAMRIWGCSSRDS